MKRRESTHSIIKIKAFSVLSLTWRGRVVKLKEKRALHLPFPLLTFLFHTFYPTVWELMP